MRQEGQLENESNAQCCIVQRRPYLGSVTGNGQLFYVTMVTERDILAGDPLNSPPKNSVRTLAMRIH